MRIEILGHTMEVIKFEPPRYLRGVEVDGEVNVMKRKIFINDSLSAAQQKQTLYHEILHAIDWILNNEDYTMDEDDINKLATGLSTLKLLKDE